MKYRRLSAAISALLLSLVVFAGSTQLASAQASGVGGKPANPDPANERSQSIFIKRLDPGQSAEDAVQIVNNSAEAKTVSVYGVDAVNSSGGAFACAQANDPKQGVGSWMTFSTNTVTLQPNEKQTIPFTINVPANASAGEQNGCVVLQEQKTTTFQGGIGVNFRTGIRVAVLVTGDIRKELSIEGLTVSQKDKKVIATPQVKNTGNVSLDTAIKTSLKPFIGPAIETQDNTFPVLRDQPTEWSFEFKQPFWGGFYRVSFSATYDQSQQGYLGTAPKDGQPTTVNGPTRWTFVMPQPLALIIEALLLITVVGGVLALWRRRKHQQHVHTAWVSYTVQKGEQLQDIAKRHHVSWKKLALSNKLKAPYHLKDGQTIKVPAAKATHKTKKGK